jgi:hypothetical protein
MKGKITIQIGGKPVSLWFTHRSVRWFIEAAIAAMARTGDKGIYWLLDEKGEATGNFTEEGFAKLVECGYKLSCFVKETEPALTYEHFCEWVQEIAETEEGGKVIKDVMACYADSSIGKKAAQAVEEEKKSPTIPPSSTLTSSSPSAMGSSDGNPGNLTEPALGTSSQPLTA